jgi:acylglycerol lipase
MEKIQKEFSLKTLDGLSLFGVSRIIPKSTIGILIVHGIGEHSGRYDHVMEAFVQEGYSVVAYDHRGHGRSGGPRGVIPEYSAFLDDLNQVYTHFEKDDSSRKWLLYGHSMGGNIVLNYACRHQDQFLGVIATSPWLKLTNNPPTWKQFFAKLGNRTFPHIALSNGLDLADLSRDSEVGRIYDTDPLTHDRISSRLYCGILEAGGWVMENANNLSIPSLIMHGDSDQITDPKASELFSSRSLSSTFRLWLGAFHELHSETNKEEVIAFILAWISDNFIQLKK